MTGTKNVYETAQKKSIDLYQVEKEALGITHCDIGGYFASRWNFPLPVVDAIKFHRTPEEAGDNQLLATVVNLSDLFTRLLGLNYGINESLLVAIEEQKSFLILKNCVKSLENTDWEKFSLELTKQYKQITESVKAYFKTDEC